VRQPGTPDRVGKAGDLIIDDVGCGRRRCGSVGEIPVPPDVRITSTFSPIAANSARLTATPSGTTIRSGVTS